MKQNIVETIVGFIVIIIAGIFCLFAYNINNSSSMEGSYSVHAQFENIEGIVNGSDVMLAGVKIGDVEKITLDKTKFMAIVNLRINKNIKLPKDSQAIVTTSGFLGGKFISITPGGDTEDLAANDQIKRTQSSVNLESLIGKLIYSFANKKS